MKKLKYTYDHHIFRETDKGNLNVDIEHRDNLIKAWLKELKAYNPIAIIFGSVYLYKIEKGIIYTGYISDISSTLVTPENYDSYSTNTTQDTYKGLIWLAERILFVEKELNKFKKEQRQRCNFDRLYNMFFDYKIDLKKYDR